MTDFYMGRHRDKGLLDELRDLTRMDVRARIARHVDYLRSCRLQAGGYVDRHSGGLIWLDDEGGGRRFGDSRPERRVPDGRAANGVTEPSQW